VGVDVSELQLTGEHRLERVDLFYAEHMAHAVGWATALTGRVDVGEELAQEALLSTIELLDDLRNPAAYLRVSVVNGCRSWHRSVSREQRRAVRAHREAPATVVSESTAEMLDLLGDLPYRHRAALLLRFWAGWTDVEIAEALKCRPASVRVFVHRGLTALRSVIDNEQEKV
jgi:RNA polymerase sigma factor (sigma-70 family)